MPKHCVLLFATLLAHAQTPGPDANKAITPIVTPRRLALVIGNANYQYQSAIPQALNDAADMADTLKALGFTVTPLTNTRVGDLDRALDKFYDSITPGSLALFYYSGHGGSLGEENYLLPIEFQQQDNEAGVERAASAMSKIRNRMEARGARVRLLVFDACRNAALVASKDTAAGLVEIKGKPEGTLIAYASAHGQVSRFPMSARNSYYTGALIQHLRDTRPGVDLKSLLEDTADTVYQETGAAQMPYLYGRLFGKLYLRGPDPELGVYRAAKESVNKSCENPEPLDLAANRLPFHPDWASELRSIADACRHVQNAIRSGEPEKLEEESRLLPNQPRWVADLQRRANLIRTERLDEAVYRQARLKSDPQEIRTMASQIQVRTELADDLRRFANERSRQIQIEREEALFKTGRQSMDPDFLDKGADEIRIKPEWATQLRTRAKTLRFEMNLFAAEKSSGDQSRMLRAAARINLRTDLAAELRKLAEERAKTMQLSRDEALFHAGLSSTDREPRTLTSGSAKLPETVDDVESQGRILRLAGEYANEVALYRRLSESGSIRANALLGLVLARGQGVAKDDKAAMLQCKAAEESGDARGFACMAELLFVGKGAPRDPKAALEYARRSHEAGDALGTAILALAYRNGWAVPTDQARAEQLYRDAASRGEGSAMRNLGNLERKFSLAAFDWFKKGAETGDVESMGYVGEAYLRGRPISKEPGKAIPWLRAAAAGGNAHASVLLGLCYLDGTGVKGDLKRGLALIEQGAKAGDREGAISLGQTYWKADLYDAAFVWNQVAAKAGDANAKCLVGEAYYAGKGPSQSDELAAKWFEDAYVTGSPDGTYWLASAYEFGRGKPQNAERANQLHAQALARRSPKELNRAAVLRPK